MKSIENNFDNPRVNTLLHYHFYQLRSNSPEGSTHVLDIEGLKIPSIKFWSIWDEEKLSPQDYKDYREDNNSDNKKRRFFNSTSSYFDSLRSEYEFDQNLEEDDSDN